MHPFLGPIVRAFGDADLPPPRAARHCRQHERVPRERLFRPPTPAGRSENVPAASARPLVLSKTVNMLSLHRRSFLSACAAAPTLAAQSKNETLLRAIAQRLAGSERLYLRPEQETRGESPASRPEQGKPALKARKP